MPATAKTAIEDAIERAEAENPDDGYHVHLAFPDGSIVEAPHVAYGPNWIAFDKILDDPLHVDTAGAVITVRWLSPEIRCSGPRFRHVDKTNCGHQFQAPAP